MNELCCKPYDWLEGAVIYNHRFEVIPADWFRENADALVLLFTANGVDRDGILQKFYRIYEDIKFCNLPVEVIYIPLDDTEDNMIECFEHQANWFALKFSDPLVNILKFMYAITCLPHIYVIKIDGSLISTHGILDLEKYGRNAVLSWLCTASTMKQHRKLARETVYGDKWRIADHAAVDEKPEYNTKFTHA